jgi:hypothetical protein
MALGLGIFAPLRESAQAGPSAPRDVPAFDGWGAWTSQPRRERVLLPARSRSGSLGPELRLISRRSGVLAQEARDSCSLRFQP